MLLTPDQLVELTGKRRSDSQRRELEHLRIPYRARRDGSLVVLAADVAGSATVAARIAAPEPELQP